MQLPTGLKSHNDTRELYRSDLVTTSNAVKAAEGTEKRASPEAKRLHCARASQGAAYNATGVIAPFVVKTAAEANAAPLHSGIPRRGKQRHGSHRAFRRQDRS